MNLEEYIHQCRQMTGNETTDPLTPDSLIGLFQCFRPDGKSIKAIFPTMEEKEDLTDRLDQLFQVAGNDRRPDGGRDAYFVIRQPPPLTPSEADQLGRSWLDGIRSLIEHCDQEYLLKVINPNIQIRILEGIPPKHPKIESEQSLLYRSIRKCGDLTKAISCRVEATALHEAYYFIACDPMLRDYLMWPFYRDATQLRDPLAGYFQLWRHGVKFRIFEESQIDLYLPRQL